MVHGVKKFIESERIDKITEQLKKIKLEQYHKEILDHNIKRYSWHNARDSVILESEEKFDFSSRLNSLSTHSLHLLDTPPKIPRLSLPVLPKTSLISMSKDLGENSTNVFQKKGKHHKKKFKKRSTKE